MVTKEEFEREWKARDEGSKFIVLDFGWIAATRYRIEGELIELNYYTDKIATIDLGQIVRVI